MKTNEVLSHTFLKGLEYNAQVLLNSAAGGQALSIKSKVFFKLLDKLSEGNKGYERGNVQIQIPKTYMDHTFIPSY